MSAIITPQDNVIKNVTQSLSCKITLTTANGEKELRRASVAPTFSAVHAAVAAMAGSAAVVLRYVDDEGDLVRFVNDAELAEAVRVATVNGVLRISAEPAPASAAAPTAAPAATAPASSPEDAAFWAELPVWLQAKVVARTAEHQGAVAHLPLSAVEHFACLPADVKAMLRQRAAQHAESRRAKLLKKEAHHRDAAAHLQAKAHKLLAKAAHQQEIAAMKHAKLQEPEINKNKNKDENGAAGVATDDDDDAALWARVPAHVKARIVSRWCPERAADIDASSVFTSLPAFVRDRVRHHAARRERSEDDDGEESAERRRRCREEHREQQHRRHAHGGRHGWWRAQQQQQPQQQPHQAMPAATATMPVMPPHAGAAFENAPRADMVPQPPTM